MATRTIKCESPNSWRRYPADAAYARRIASPPIASSISRCDASGSCQPVMSPSTTRMRRSGVIIRFVQPLPAWTTPASSATVSSARTTVVPIAITRPVRSLMRRAVCAETS